VVPLVNKVAGPVREEFSPALAAAHDLADHLLACKDIEAVVLGAVQQPDPVIEVRGRVAAVVLAAGAARRYGALKQLLPWGTGTMLSQVVDTALASGARPVVVVLGSQAEACRSALGDRPVMVVINPAWARGQSSSLQAGLAALPGNVMAALFPLADQPQVTVATLDALIERHRASLAPVVWPAYRGQRGTPVLFGRELFPELMRLTQDVGGRALLGSHAASAERVDVPDAGILLDIDTPQDYQDAGGNE
jgi:molybdenum cofactor cytidylyltransferase